MKAFAKANKRSLILVAAVACLMVAASISALAVPAPQVFLTFEPKTLTGKCCFVWGDTIKVTEPSAVVPVVVMWSAEYRTNRAFYVGLSVNGGPCIAHGPRSMDAYFPTDGSGASRVFQWIVDPSEMVRGTNTFTVCGGGVFNNDDTILLGIRSLAVRIGK